VSPPSDHSMRFWIAGENLVRDTRDGRTIYPVPASSPSSHPSRSVGHVLTISAAFRQQKQLVYGTLDSQNDLQRAIVQVSNDVKSAEAVR
jgi:hypothetical protein